MRLALCLVALLLVACGGVAVDATPAPTREKPTPAPTAVNYTALRMSLLVPLQSLIVAVRSNDAANSARFLADFNTAADTVLPAIAQDMSPNANRLHSVIVNTREAAAQKDVTVLEAQRRTLLDVR